MSARNRWRVGTIRRATRNRLLPIDWSGRPLLIKYTRNRDEARQEIQGHARLLGHYRVPALHAHVRVPGGYLLAYERLPGGTDRGLLLDLLNEQVAGPELMRYMDELTGAYREVILETAQEVPPSRVVRKLYWDRAAPDGRLDRYYADGDIPVAEGIIDLPVSRLAEYVIVVNGRPLALGWASALRKLRSHFQGDEPVWAALTQGDPTDVNLAHPPAWFDYDTAGLNSILGEFANFLWYVTALGGWLVPTYNPAAFADHPATFHRVDANRPRLERARVNHAARTIQVDYTPLLSAPRQAAASAYWHRLVRPVADKLWPESDLGELLRPYLAMRILAVYNLADLAPTDRLLVLARLAEAVSQSFDPITFFSIEEARCPAP
ncbi:hypothetical protein [Actinacidiphila bryophytorum]|uniref:Uncharacterized protein n=1 Tax=Actinacidiphila bryophytorum TaxID=1436133 RepID=A0A9W4H1W2_9ACTN|nr:hypothetical protein [Actinacidiphila bryophytorum]MBM9435161.1 hypothetical protein [Actinacidiphila bryophytorum]MBN6541542.1 hypothetical protein [Actinacidiphila bryophytorum]CAG7643480.1 conserved hypothetical protein [Actinacidiphila bryophytorum]